MTRRRALSDDVFESPAVAILLQLEADGFEVGIAGDRLRVKPISQLTSDRRKDLEQYRCELLLLLRVSDTGVQDRRRVFAGLRGTPLGQWTFRPGVALRPGACYRCGDRLAVPRPGRCWRCGLAARLACHAPIPLDLMITDDEAQSA